MGGIGDEKTNEARDRCHEAARRPRAKVALRDRVLWLRPTCITERELLLSPFAEGPEVEACERAIRDLVSVGLLRREGESILPTLAAIEAREISR